MKIEIDQSGRVEYTSKPTVIAFAGDRSASLIISAAEKRKLQKYFRRANKPKIFIDAVFAVLIYFLIRNIERIDQIVIDREYSGHEGSIKNLLLKFLRSGGRSFDKHSIHFTQIGKKSQAHKIAIKSYRSNKADTRIEAKDIIDFLSSKKSGVL